MGDLKPCPFCGSAPAFDSAPGRTYVWCANDQCIVWTPCPAPFNDYRHRDAAIAAWNRRSPTPEEQHSKKEGE